MIQTLRGKKYLMRVQVTPTEIEQMYASYRKKYPLQSDEPYNFYHWLVTSGKIYKEMKEKKNSGRGGRIGSPVPAGFMKYADNLTRDEAVKLANKLVSDDKKLRKHGGSGNYGKVQFTVTFEGPGYKRYGVFVQPIVDSEFRKSNPSETADAISSGFHGRKVSERFEVEEEELYPDNLAVLGCLVELVIKCDGGEIPIRGFKTPFSPGYKEGDEVYLAAADRHNLEFIGGNQEIVNASVIAKHTDKRLVRLGKVKDIVYLADKHHLIGSNGREEEYEHSFGRKKYFLFGKQTGQPDLLYDILNKTMKLVGGSYTIEDEGIKN